MPNLVKMQQHVEYETWLNAFSTRWDCGEYKPYILHSINIIKGAKLVLNLVNLSYAQPSGNYPKWVGHKVSDAFKEKLY